MKIGANVLTSSALLMATVEAQYSRKRLIRIEAGPVSARHLSWHDHVLIGSGEIAIEFRIEMLDYMKNLQILHLWIRNRTVARIYNWYKVLLTIIELFIWATEDLYAARKNPISTYTRQSQTNLRITEEQRFNVNKDRKCRVSLPR